MAETTKQITFEQRRDANIGQMTYKIKRLFNMHNFLFPSGAKLRIGATYDSDDFKTLFATSKEFQSVDIILE